MTNHIKTCRCKITCTANFVFKSIYLFVSDLLLLTETVGEDQAFASPFGYCTQEVLLCCHPILSEEYIAARLSLAQRLETTLRILSTATDGAGQHSNQGFSGAVMLTISLFW